MDVTGTTGVEKMFKLNMDADVNGTHLQSKIQVSPTRLVEVFGMPQECDQYKVSGQYVFEGPDGDVFTLYDWKSTSLYNPGLAPDPKMLWVSLTPKWFNIGGHNSASDFVQWLDNKVN